MPSTVSATWATTLVSFPQGTILSGYRATLTNITDPTKPPIVLTTPVGSTRAVFSNVPAGTYSGKVSAMNNQAVDFGVPAEAPAPVTAVDTPVMLAVPTSFSLVVS